jgi:hypothetical protein
MHSPPVTGVLTDADYDELVVRGDTVSRVPCF